MKTRIIKTILILSLLFALLASPVFSAAVRAQTTNKIVSVPGDAAYSGTYEYQGTRNSHPYYRLSGSSYYLYVDNYCGNTGWTTWVLGILAANPDAGQVKYYHWPTSGANPASNPGDPQWYESLPNSPVSISITDEASGVAPTVSTEEASLVTTTAGTLIGNIIADGGAATSRGFVFSATDATPTIGEPGVTQIAKGAGTGTFTELVGSLTPGGAYYFQAYGVNTHGTSYGGVKSFTTPTTSQPNKYVSGITAPAAANGVYIWIGNYYGRPAWKHQTLDYWVYYSRYGNTYPDNYYWYIDDELKNEHGSNDYLFYHSDAVSCPVSGWTAETGAGTAVTVVDYPNISFSNGASYSPASPLGGTSSNPIGRFALSGELSGASLTAATVTVSGTRAGVTNFRLWSSGDNSFSPGSDTLLNSQPDGSTVTFSGFSSAISTSGTFYFVTADLDLTASGSITLTIGSNANLTISGGAIASGFSNAPLSGGAVTITEAVDMNVRGNGVSIADGDTTPGASDGTDFGGADVAAGSVAHTFTIESLGAGALSLTGPSPYVVITGATADFTLTQVPSGSIAGGSSTDFQVTFNPTSTGIKTAAISIASNDADENPYNFSIQGTGTAAPEIDISGGSISIADGDTTPDAADGTDFGAASLPSGLVEHTFTITNTGLAALTVDSIILSGHTDDFHVTQMPSGSVAAGGGTTTFEITFTPTATGTRSAEVSIASNDADENPYTFLVQGRGVSAPTVTTAAAAGITTSGATLGGNITSDGGEPVSAAGVVYSTSDSTPVIGEPGVTQDTNDDSTGAFSESIGGMAPAAHYYYQAYATNAQGTAYGGVVEFTTLNAVVSITRSGSALTNAASVSWTVTFEAAATGLTPANFALVNTGLAGPSITAVSASGGTTWTVTASTGAGSGTLGLNLTSDAGLNAGLSNAPYSGPEFTLDRTPPTVTVEQAEGQDDPVTVGPINFTVVFSEAVTGFDAAGVAISGTAGATTATITGSGTTYNVAVSGMARAGTVMITIPAGAAQDAAGNDSGASTSVDHTVTYAPFHLFFPVVRCN